MVLAVATAVAPGQGFQPGDLYLVSPTVTGVSASSGGLVHIEPTTGNGSILLHFATTPSLPDLLAFDPHRNALLFMAQLAATSTVQLYQCDASGGAQSLGFANRSLSALAPTGDGRVYLRDRQDVVIGRIHYLDANNQFQTLMDAGGLVPFEFFAGQGTPYECMLYHAPTNALFVALNSGTTRTCGGVTANTGVVVRRVTLSADGGRAVGPVLCAEFEVSTSGEGAVGLDQFADGTLLVVVDTNANAAEPRMIRVDPWTMVATAYATNGFYTGAASTNAGCCTSALGAIVVLDTFNDVLRRFAFGQTGSGSPVALSVPISAPGSSGEVSSLVQVVGASCSGSLVGYGDGLQGSAGFVPNLSGTSCPIPGSTIDLHIGSGLGGGIGVLGFGYTAAAVPLFGGTLLVAPVTTSTIFLQGTPNAAGEGHQVQSLAVPANPSLSGLSLYVQGAVLDPGAVQGVSLTSGLHIVIG